MLLIFRLYMIDILLFCLGTSGESYLTINTKLNVKLNFTTIKPLRLHKLYNPEKMIDRKRILESKFKQMRQNLSEPLFYPHNSNVNQGDV